MKNPFKKEKPTTFESIELNERMNIQAGLTDIKTEEQLRNRVLFNDEALVAEINDVSEALATLYAKKERSSSDDALILRLERQRKLYRFYRSLKKSSTAFGLAGQYEGISKKLGAIDWLFFSCQDNEAMQSLVLTAMEKNVNDCYSEDWQIKPAPSLLMNKPIVMTQGGGFPVTPTSGLPGKSDKPADRKYEKEVDPGVQ